MKQIRKKHSPAFKAKVALAALQGEHTDFVPARSRPGSTHESLLPSWPAGLKSTPARFTPGRRPPSQGRGQALVQGAPQLFENGSGRQEKDQEALTAQLYQQIGQLKVERDFLSRRSGL
jgi:hypothetical protein